MSALKKLLSSFRKKSDKIVYAAVINGDLKIFDDESSMAKFLEEFSSENYISSLSVFRCELHNFSNNK